MGMTPKEYLNQIRCLDEKLRHRKQQIEEIRTKCESISGIDYSKDRVQTSNGNGQEKILVKYLDMVKELEADLLLFRIKQTNIIREIEELSDERYMRLLYSRYVQYKSLEQIAVEMNYNYFYIKHIHGEALEQFRKEVMELRKESKNGENYK